jgi:hypothetical protein
MDDPFCPINNILGKMKCNKQYLRYIYDKKRSKKVIIPIENSNVTGGGAKKISANDH